jgi:hypothetical protein
MQVRKTLIAGLVMGAVCAAPATSFAYGPGGGGGPTPPGFGPTLTSSDVGPDGGGTNGSADGCNLKVSVPKGTFKIKTTVVISHIKNAVADGHLGPSSHSVCAFGVALFRNGHQVHVARGHLSLNLLFSGDPIQSADKLFVLIQGGSHKKPATFETHQATSKLRSTLEMAIVSNPSFKG